MTIKPLAIEQDAIVDQVKELSSEKNNLEVQIEVLERKLENIKASIAENEDLKTKNKILQEQVLKQFEEEWKRRAEYYPDIHLAILMKAAALNAAPPPKKE